jgi:N6-adenosine-specific RNA methylase IME4
VYGIIYADPPWRYGFSKSGSRKIENHYPTMSIAEICALKVPAAKDAVLYLWATAPKLPEALEVVRAWGFEYKSCAVWDKLNLGMGYWFRGQHELLLVGVRGNVSPPDQRLRVSSVFQEKRTKHSRKPTLIRDLIASWYPQARKLEMFARQTADGWDCWGNEVVSVPLTAGFDENHKPAIDGA